MDRRRTVLAFFLILSITLTLSVSCGTKEETYKKPESFVVDPATGEYYVSNVNGIPSEKDQNGFIVKLDKDLKIVDAAFIESGGNGVDLNAPKGMAIVGEVLYVTDITSVRGYDKKTGENVVDLDLEDRGAKFLNDITADEDGNLYVSDMTSNVIFKIETKNDNAVSEHRKGNELEQPNGLAIDPKTGDLVIAAWRGKILVLDEEGNLKPYVDKEFVAPDGIDFDDEGNLYVSSFQLGEIYKITSDKKVTTIKKGLDSPADISVDRKKGLLLVPLMGANKITTIDLKEE